jgi:hypothetical protein
MRHVRDASRGKARAQTTTKHGSIVSPRASFETRSASSWRLRAASASSFVVGIRRVFRLLSPRGPRLLARKGSVRSSETGSRARNGSFPVPEAFGGPNIRPVGTDLPERWHCPSREAQSDDCRHRGPPWAGRGRGTSQSQLLTCGLVQGCAAGQGRRASNKKRGKTSCHKEPPS